MINKSERSMINLVIRVLKVKDLEDLVVQKTSVASVIYLTCFSAEAVVGEIQMLRDKGTICNIRWSWNLKKLFLGKKLIFIFQVKKIVIRVMDQVLNLVQNQRRVNIVTEQVN